MRNYKQFFTGVLVGGLLLSGGTALAGNNTLPSITNWVKYQFNGVEKSLPDGYTTLNFEGHTYVPTRFIAEELGAKVEWNNETQTVQINYPENDKDITEENNSSNQNEQPKDDSQQKPLISYEALPVADMENGLFLEVNSIELDPNYTKIYVTLKNTTEKPVQLNQESAFIKTEFDTYSHAEVKGNILYWKDKNWFKDLGEDDDAEGYIMLPSIPSDEREGEFYVEVFQNDTSNDVTKFNFNIKW